MRTALMACAGMIIVGVIIAAVAWHLLPPAPAPAAAWVAAAPAPQLFNLPQQIITPPAVRVYAPPAKQKLDLPDAIKNDPAAHVIAATRVPIDPRPQTVTSLIDARTGTVTTLIRRDDYPLLATQRSGELRLDYGYKNAHPITRLTLRADLVQIKAAQLGIAATLDTDGQHFVGAGVGFKW